MPYIANPWFDTSVFAEKRLSDHRVLIVCLVIAGIAHLVLLSYLQIETSSTTLQRTLQVTIRQVPVKPQTLERGPTQAEDTLSPPEFVETLEDTDFLSHSNPETRESLPPAKTASGFQLYQQVLDAASQVKVPGHEEKTHSFSTGDFPRTAVQPDPYARPAAIRQFATRARKVVEHDMQGNVTVRQVDEFGNVTCMQQRGFAGDGNPPLWYPIIGDACFVTDSN